MRRRAFAVLVVLGVASIAQAQSAEPPTFAVGDSWKRSSGLEITVVKVDESRTVMTGFLADCPACPAHFNKEFQLLEATDPSGKPIDIMRVRGVLLGPSWKFFDWPLEVGKSWKFSAEGAWKGSVVPYNIDITIAAYEEVKTKAGTFKAYKMQRSWSVGGFGAQRFEWRDTLWYAPDVRSAIKLTSTNPNTKDWELVSYSLK